MKKRIVFLIYAIIGFVIAFLFCISKKIFAAADAKEVFRILSDAFLIPAMFYIGISLLGFVASTGFFDIFGFGTGSVLSRFNPAMDKEKYTDYYHYKAEKEKKGRTWNPKMLVCGIAAMGISVVFLVIYYLV